MFAAPITLGSLGTDLPTEARRLSGFGWWYLDCRDEQGKGAVIIFSLSLPFSPNARNTVGLRPTVNLSMYAEGQCVSTLMVEYDPNDVSRDQQTVGDVITSTVRIGANTLEWRRSAATHAVDVEASLCLPVAGSETPFIANLQMVGQAPAQPHRVPASLRGDSDHEWAVVSAALVAHFSAHHESFLFRLENCTGYFDRNSAATKLNELGISSWIWGRLAPASGNGPHLVFYVLTNTSGLTVAHGFEFESSATRVVPLTVRCTDPRSDWGLPWFQRLELVNHEGRLWGNVTLDAPVESSPFYSRHMTRGQNHSQTFVGTAEFIRPARVDHPLFRPFVQMCTHAARASLAEPWSPAWTSRLVADLIPVHRPWRNSTWLAAFTGPRESRLKRLLGRGNPNTPA